VTTPNANLGDAVTVTLPLHLHYGTEFKIKLTYKTNEKQTATSWLTPE